MSNQAGLGTSHAIFGFVAASGSGKTTMVEAAVHQLAGTLQIIRSASTRASRGPSDDPHYEFFSRDEFDQLIRDDELVYHVEYAGNRYGILKREIERVLAASDGILALVEQSVRLLRAAGYTVHVMKVVTKGKPEFPDATRRTADAERAKDPLNPDVVIENDFTKPDGLQRATAQMTDFICRQQLEVQRVAV